MAGNKEHVWSAGGNKRPAEACQRLPRLGRPATALAVAAGLVVLSTPARALPLPGFVENRGQEDPRVAFSAQTPYGTVYVTHAREIVYVVAQPDDLVARTDGAIGTAPKAPDGAPSAGRARQAGSVADSRAEPGPDVLSPTEGSGFDLRSRRRNRAALHRRLALYETVLGAGPGEIRGQDRRPTAVQYFIGNDPAGWLVDVPVYARLDFGEVAPGIRLGLHLRDRGVEKVFTVEPGASLDALRLRIDGAAGLVTGPTGRLELLTDTGRLAFTRPKAWQVGDTGRRVPVSVGYRVAGDSYRFVTGPHDPSRPLFIDPLMASTYFGGAWDDSALDVAADAQPSVYVLLDINSSDFPTVPGGFDPVFTHGDTAVALLDPEMTAMRSLTYLGGTWEDQASRLALLPDGGVGVVGWTVSEDFPVTPGAYQTSWGGEFGSIELFLAVLSRDLRHLRAATYLGGTRDEEAFALAVADNGDIVVTGHTVSSDFPTTSAAYQATDPDPGGGDLDADGFVTRLTPDLTAVVASTYFGAGNYDTIDTIAIDPSGDFVVAGTTYSDFLPLTPGAFDTTPGGIAEGFLARFDGDLTTLRAASYFGGGSDEGIVSVALGPDGTIWCAGTVLSGGIPVTPGAFSTISQRCWAPFVAGLSPDLTTLYAATYLHAPDHGNGMACGGARFVGVDPVDGGVVVAGQAWTDGYPVPPDAFETDFSASSIRSGFVVRLARDLTLVNAATFVGAPVSGEDVFGGMVLDDGSVLLAGETRSDFPVWPSAFQSEPAGGKDGFAIHLSRDLAADPPGCNTGDADADGRITALDAQRVWALALGFDRPEAFERCRADCNADGRITAGDAQGVHAASLGAGSCADALPPQ